MIKVFPHIILFILLPFSIPASAQRLFDVTIHDDIYLSTYIPPIAITVDEAVTYTDSYFIKNADSYSLEWEENFKDTPTDLSAWNLDTYPQKGLINFDNKPPGEIQYYTADNIILEADRLKIIAKEFNQDKLSDPSVNEQILADGQPNLRHYKYSSGAIISKREFHYGKFEAKIKIPPVKCLWPAFWMFGGSQSNILSLGNGNRRCEIDIFEFFKSDGDKMVSSLHYWLFRNSRHQNYYDGNSYKALTFEFENEWHIYGMEWNQFKLIFTLDDNPLPGAHYHYYALSPDQFPKASFDGNLNLTNQNWGLPVRDVNDLINYTHAGYKIYVNRLFPNVEMPLIFTLAVQQSNDPPLLYNDSNKYLIKNDAVSFPQSMDVEWVKYYKPERADTLFTFDDLLQMKSPNIKIFPNPSTDKVQIIIPQSLTGGELQINNSIGVTYYKGQIVEFVDVSEFDTGFYLFRITKGNYSQVVKFIKQ